MPQFDRPNLLGRERECAELDRLLSDVFAGRSRVLVVRGDPGVGKTALLDYLGDHSTGSTIVRVSGYEAEAELAFSALHQLCVPFLASLEALPAPQQAALEIALGLREGQPPEGLVVGLAALGLLAESAAEKPVICLVDDEQWIDGVSRIVLRFVARRLDAESVGLVFASRNAEESQAGLPELVVKGLPDPQALALLDSVLTAPVETRVRERIVAEARGNPLALMELPRWLAPAELAFGFSGIPPSRSLANTLERGFYGDIAGLPAATRELLLVAAVEPVGDVSLLLRALQSLDITLEDAAPAEAAGLIEITGRVRFRHPLLRSAAWRSADPAEVRHVHSALAEMIDPLVDPDRRAWHRAHAAVLPDEEVATELEQSAGRAAARGGRAAASAFLERAAELSPAGDRKAIRLLAAARARLEAGMPRLASPLLDEAEAHSLDPAQQILVSQVRAQIALATNPGVAVTPLLLAAAQLQRDDEAAAETMYLSAIGAAFLSGRLGDDVLSSAARAVPPASKKTGPNSLLRALVAWALDGYAGSIPLFTEALDELRTEPDFTLTWLSVPAAIEMWDLESWFAIADQVVDFSRRTGATSLLPTSLSFEAAVMVAVGNLRRATELLVAAQVIEESSGVSPRPSSRLALAAYRGREKAAMELIERATQESHARNEGRLLAAAVYAKAILFNGLGRYREALSASLEAISYPDIALYNWALPEVVESAMRAGEPAVAAEAQQQLVLRTTGVESAWAKATRTLGMALIDSGADAGRLYEEAIELFASTPLAIQLARARLLHGEWLRRSGRPADARVVLRSAYDAFTEMGAEAFAERAGRELVAGGDTVHKRTTDLYGGLTPQELQIARMAGSGNTNAEIGTTLFLSPRTVEWHLRKVFSKLNVRSRRELTSVLTQQSHGL